MGGAQRKTPPSRADVVQRRLADRSKPGALAGGDYHVLVEAFEAHGFRAPCAWYLNDDANIIYMRRAANGGRITQPVLFINGAYDQMNSIEGNALGDPMRAACADLTVTSLAGAHWLPVERKTELVRAIQEWLRARKLG